MGFKPLPWVDPCECWAEPGHIFMREYDGSVTDYPSSIKVSIPKQCNDFQSPCAQWVLRHDDSFFCGNVEGFYQQVRIADRVLLTCGTWDVSARPRTVLPCGIDENDEECVLDMQSRRIIYVPSTYGAYLLKQPIMPGEVVSAMLHAYNNPGNVIICSEKGVLDLAVSGSWVPAPPRTVSYPPIQLQLRYEQMRPV